MSTTAGHFPTVDDFFTRVLLTSGDTYLRCNPPHSTTYRIYGRPIHSHTTGTDGDIYAGVSGLYKDGAATYQFTSDWRWFGLHLVSMAGGRLLYSTNTNDSYRTFFAHSPRRQWLALPSRLLFVDRTTLLRYATPTTGTTRRDAVVVPPAPPARTNTTVTGSFTGQIPLHLPGLPSTVLPMPSILEPDSGLFGRRLATRHVYRYTLYAYLHPPHSTPTSSSVGENDHSI